MDYVQELQNEFVREREATTDSVQAGSWLLELSLDWIVLRASENIHQLLHESHVTLIEEPLGRFVHAQALHDLRNLFSRLSGTTGIARAYGIRLTDELALVDVAFQLCAGCVILEAVPSTGSFGAAFGSVGGLFAGLAGNRGQTLLDNGARRMRALTGYDRVTLSCAGRRAESSRGLFEAGKVPNDLPMMVSDAEEDGVPIFPRESDESSCADALMRGCDPAAREALSAAGVRACLRIPFEAEGFSGEFRCDSRTAREPCFELHAAAELFAQLFATQLKIDELRSSD